MIVQSRNDCGCCAGITIEIPLVLTNRPGLSAIAYRVGTYQTFRKSLHARLSDARSDLRQHVRSHLFAAGGKTGHGPRGGNQSGDIRHLNLQPSHLHGIDIVQHRAAILAVVFLRVVHTGTSGVMETNPFRVS